MSRLFDILFSIVCLFIFGPVMFCIVIVSFFIFRKSIFFIQFRPGLQGKVFSLYKFRTMLDDRDSSGELLPDCARTTKFGRFLRLFSLDELPQLWNILKGDMSFVGPRPLLVEYLPLYSSEQKRRHEVRPGITGWAQVNGRNAIPWDEKFKLDVWYIDNRSFFLDMKIIGITVLKVFRGVGVNHDAHVTMEKFTGSE